MRSTHRSRLLALAATATLSAGIAAPAQAAPSQQGGLANVNVSDVDVAVPIAAASWGVMLLVGLAGILALAFRRTASPRTLAVAGALTGSLPWLAIGLLLVGHLPSLTYATAVPFLVLIVAVGVAPPLGRSLERIERHHQAPRGGVDVGIDRLGIAGPVGVTIAHGRQRAPSRRPAARQ